MQPSLQTSHHCSLLLQDKVCSHSRPTPCELTSSSAQVAQGLPAGRGTVSTMVVGQIFSRETQVCASTASCSRSAGCLHAALAAVKLAAATAELCTTQAIFYNWKPSPVQRMLDYDFVAGQQACLT